MKRKVKFQEGGEVERPARLPARESARNRQLRETMERVRREGRRVGLAERARQRQTASDAARRAATAERTASQRADADFTRRVQSGRVDAETMRRMGATELPSGRQDFTTDSRGTTRRGAATGREMVPYREPGVPATQGGRGMVPPGQGGAPRQIPLFPSGTPRIPGPVASAARRFIPGLGALDAVSPTSLEEGARFEREGLRQAREARELAPPADGPAAGSMQTAPRPTPAAADGPAVGSMQTAPRPRPRPAPRRELTMEEIRALRSGERAPRSSEERALREGLRDLPVMTEADRLNERELQRIRAARAAEEEAARQMGGSGNIGSASARERGELEGHPGDFTYNNYKKGGMVKPKAAPKKMMKGGIVAKPKAAAKSKPKPKPMPFKKGGVIKKGRK